MPAKMLVSLEYRKFGGIWQGLNIYQNCSKFINLSALSRTKRGQIKELAAGVEPAASKTDNLEYMLVLEDRKP
jgi:hypothetical protein